MKANGSRMASSASSAERDEPRPHKPVRAAAGEIRMKYTIRLHCNSPATMVVELARLAADINKYEVGAETCGKDNARQHLVYSGPQTRVVSSWWTAAGNIVVSDDGPIFG